VVVVKVFSQLLPQHFISLALMTECYSAFKQPRLDVFGKITPKIDHRRTHDAGTPIIIPLVQDDGRFYLGDKIYCCTANVGSWCTTRTMSDLSPKSDPKRTLSRHRRMTESEPI
jgi:hypothetical protein